MPNYCAIQGSGATSRSFVEAIAAEERITDSGILKRKTTISQYFLTADDKINTIGRISFLDKWGKRLEVLVVPTRTFERGFVLNCFKSAVAPPLLFDSICP